MPDSPLLYRILGISSIFLIGLAIGALIWLAFDKIRSRQAPPPEPVTPIQITPSRETLFTPPAAPPISLPDDEVSSLRAHVARLEEEMLRRDEALAGLEAKLDGSPLAWPDPIPEAYQAKVFVERTERAIEACMLELELLRVECDEPPCAAILRRPRAVHSEGARWLNVLTGACPTWNDSYGTEISLVTDSVPCDGTRREGFTFLAPTWPDLTDGSEAALENQGRRFRRRAERAKEAWTCRTAD